MSNDEIKNKIDQLQYNQHQLQNNYNEMNKIIQNVVQNQKILLKASQRKGIVGRIKQFIKPRIGVLNQSDPIPLVIPSKYYDKIALTQTPTISIVTPSFNQQKFIERTIKSVIDQNYPSLEFVIQDGGSTDGSDNIIRDYASSLAHWESKKDNGQSNAINLGFNHTTGEIMAYLNSDDLLLPGSLHYVAKYFSDHPEVDVVYGHRVLINEDDQEIGRWVLPKHDSKVLSWADYIPQETLFWRRRIWEKVGGIDESFRFAMDWDLLLRFRDAGAKFVRLPRFLGAFRIHSSQKTSAEIGEIGNKEMARLRTRNLGRDVLKNEIHRNLLVYMFKHFIVHKLYRAGVLHY